MVRDGSSDRLPRGIEALVNRGLLVSTLLFAAAICAIVLLLLPIDDARSLVRIEPLVYLVFLLLFVQKESITGPGTTILVVAFFFKLCALPIINYMGDYFSSVPESWYLPYWNLACLGIAEEWIVCSVCIRLFGRMKDRRVFRGRAERYTLLPINLRNNPVFYMVAIGFVAIMVALIAAFNGFRFELYLAWMNDTTSLVSPKNSFYYLFKWVLERGRILLFLLLASLVFQKGKRVGRWVILLAAASALVFTEYRIRGLVIAATIVAFYIMSHGAKRHARVMLKAFGFVLVVALIYVSTMHNDLDRNMGNLSRLLDIYCGGYIQAATSWGVDVPNGFFGLFNSVWNQSLFLSNAVGSFYPSTETLKYAYLAGTGSTLAQGTFFEMSALTHKTVGLFSPFFLAVPVVFTIWADHRCEHEQNILYKLVYLHVAIATGVFTLMYTYNMIIAEILYYECLMLALVFIDRRIVSMEPVPSGIHAFRRLP